MVYVCVAADYERQMQFYGEALGAFPNFDAVIVDVVKQLMRRMMRIEGIASGTASQSMVNQAKATVALCFSTVPSILDPIRRVQLYRLCAHTALVVGALAQAEALMACAVETLGEIGDVPDIDADAMGRECFLSIMGGLILCPDAVEEGTLSLYSALHDQWDMYNWKQGHPAKTDVVLGMLAVLMAYRQSKYDLAVAMVESNDTLYGGDKRFYGVVDDVSGVLGMPFCIYMYIHTYMHVYII